jgi:hypothetical protein
LIGQIDAVFSLSNPLNDLLIPVTKLIPALIKKDFRITIIHFSTAAAKKNQQSSPITVGQNIP